MSKPAGHNPRPSIEQRPDPPQAPPLPPMTWASVVTIMESFTHDPSLAAAIWEGRAKNASALTPRQDIAARFLEASIRSGQLNAMAMAARDKWADECLKMADQILGVIE